MVNINNVGKGADSSDNPFHNTGVIILITEICQNGNGSAHFIYPKNFVMIQNMCE